MKKSNVHVQGSLSSFFWEPPDGFLGRPRNGRVRRHRGQHRQRAAPQGGVQTTAGKRPASVSPRSRKVNQYTASRIRSLTPSLGGIWPRNTMLSICQGHLPQGKARLRSN